MRVVLFLFARWGDVSLKRSVVAGDSMYWTCSAMHWVGICLPSVPPKMSRHDLDIMNHNGGGGRGVLREPLFGIAIAVYSGEEECSYFESHWGGMDGWMVKPALTRGIADVKFCHFRESFCHSSLAAEHNKQKPFSSTSSSRT